MTKIERNLLDFIKKHISIVAVSVVTLIVLMFYISFGMHFNLASPPSTDFIYSIGPWWHTVASEGGFKSLSHLVGDYTIAYQTVLAWLTTWKIGCQPSVKIFLGVIDFALAFMVAFFVRKFSAKKDLFSFAVPFIAVLLMPSVFIDSMVWGQCDCFYSLFLLLALYLMYNDKWGWGCFFYGVSFAFKLEPIMLLPFIIMFYLMDDHKNSIFNLLWAFVGFYLPNIGGVLHGQPFIEPFKTLLAQTGLYPILSSYAVNFPQLFTVTDAQTPNSAIAYTMMSQFLIVLTIAIFAIVLVFLSRKKYNVRENFIILVTWCVWTCDFFLPAMHERYDFMVGILLLVLTCLNVRYLPMLVIVEAIDATIYMNSFFNFHPSFTFMSWLMMILYGFMTYIVLYSPVKWQLPKVE